MPSAKGPKFDYGYSTQPSVNNTDLHTEILSNIPVADFNNNNNYYYNNKSGS